MPFELTITTAIHRSSVLSVNHERINLAQPQCRTACNTILLWFGCDLRLLSLGRKRHVQEAGQEERGGQDAGPHPRCAGGPEDHQRGGPRGRHLHHGERPETAHPTHNNTYNCCYEHSSIQTVVQKRFLRLNLAYRE